MTAIYDKTAKKKATNVSINEDLLKKVKSYKINISSCIEKTLEKLVKYEESKKWEEENIEAINDYNKRISKNGLFSDGLRSF